MTNRLIFIIFVDDQGTDDESRSHITTEDGEDSLWPFLDGYERPTDRKISSGR